ncbi:MAG: site-2 protease family protein [Nanoarchaeota archaeon]|nr:site-2 protease family protein [Nanoarchaeota archaeon]
MKLIDKIGKKYQKTLRFFSYVSVASGYILMAGMLYLTYTIVKIYFFSPSIVRAVKVPPIMPLVPYLPQVFKLDFLPPFYFSYWIVIIAIVAVTHELAHGIFMKRYNIKIKSTGFAFFPRFVPIFPAAFVEQDETSMVKAKNFEQMAVLGAGTFANVLTSVFFLVILLIFSATAFAPSGVVYDSYAISTVGLAGISSINGVNLNNPSHAELINHSGEGLNEITYGNSTYLATRTMLEGQANKENIIIYHSAPAIKNSISSIITKVDGIEVNSLEGLVEELSKHSPGEEITITTVEDDGEVDRDIILEEHPEMPGSSWLGIAFSLQGSDRLLGKVMEGLSFRDPNTYYEPRFDGLSVFIYNLLWWLVLIGISVAFVNMLPVGIFDGGRFFYLTVLSLTKNEKIAQRAFAISTQFFLILLFAIMIFWVVGFFR